MTNMTLHQISLIINHPRFCGLWSYRPYGSRRRFCCTVIVDEETRETRMFDEWANAVKEAGQLIHKPVMLGKRTISAGT